MKWINRENQEPDPELEYILVWSTVCNGPHVAYRDYGDWCHTEWCRNEMNGHFHGDNIDFEYWMLCPKKPRKKICTKKS